MCVARRIKISKTSNKVLLNKTDKMKQIEIYKSVIALMLFLICLGNSIYSETIEKSGKISNAKATKAAFIYITPTPPTLVHGVGR